MTCYFLGVDIGGTKSHALLADETGRALGFGTGGPGNYEVVGWDGLREVLRSVTGQALADAGIGKSQLCGSGCGIAGYDWPGDLAPTSQAIESLSLPAPYRAVNDAILGLLAGARDGWGVAIVAGTSNNCRGWDRHGFEGRVTGNGPAFGEYGGASELVARAVQQIARAWARRGPQTTLTRAFVERAGASGAADLLEGLARGCYRLSADDARLVFQAEAGGDPVAMDAVRWSGRELGSLAVGVIRQLRLEALSFDLVLAGSLFDGSRRLIECLGRTVHAVAPLARLVRLDGPPVTGAVLLAMKVTGLAPEQSVRTTLLESTRDLMGSRTAASRQGAGSSLTTAHADGGSAGI